MSTNPYDALRKIINHEANQDDDGGFFAKLGGIQPDHDDDDGPTAKGLFQHLPRDSSWELPPGLSHVINRTTYPIFFKHGWHLRTCIVWKNKKRGPLKNSFWNQIPWHWSCRICRAQGALPGWKLAYTAANHHAHNHHGRNRWETNK